MRLFPESLNFSSQLYGYISYFIEILNLIDTFTERTSKTHERENKVCVIYNILRQNKDN